LVDLDADRPDAPERLERQSQYGQVQHVFALRIPPRTKKINPSKHERILLLTLILEAPVIRDDGLEYEVAWYEGKLGSGEVVDITTIQCVIGRAQDGRRWWIIDRSTDNTFTYPEYA
jgi:hypothetical protein